MKKNLVKKGLSLITATVMAFSLAACGGGSAGTGGAADAGAPAGTDTSTAAEASDTSDGSAAQGAESTGAEGSVINIWCWNDEFQSRFNDYYPEVQEVAADKSTTTLKDGTVVKWTINPNQDNNYQNKLDEALLAQE